MCLILVGGVHNTPYLRPEHWCFFSASLRLLATLRPSMIPRINRAPWRSSSFCPLCLWCSYRSARSSAAEEDAREDLEYYAAKDDECEEDWTRGSC